MFLRILKKLKRKEASVRLLVLGLDNAGKSTYVGRLSGQSRSELQTIAPTLGFQIVSVCTADNHLLNLWDVGGQKGLRAYWRNYFEQTDGLVWVMDASSSPEEWTDSWREL